MKQKFKKRIAISVIISMLMAMYTFLPAPKTANAVDALANSSWLISDSDFLQVATSTFSFTTATSTAVNGFIRFTFPAGFTGISNVNVDCDNGDVNFAASSTGQVVDCVRSNSTQAAGNLTMEITGVTNPSDQANDYYVVLIEHYRAGAASLPNERVQVMTHLIDDVWMTARVDATLKFTVTGTTTGAFVNGIECSNTSTATATPFGTLQPNATSTVCQQLNVTTNASQGFTVTVEQDQEMTSDGNDNINSFNNSPDNTGSTTAQAWVAPSGILDSDHTYGHMGLTSNDTDLNSLGGYNDFYNGGTANFAGLNNSQPMPIYHHDGPADGDTFATQDKGKIMVLYQAEINALQQAGDYESTLTYIATPIY